MFPFSYLIRFFFPQPENSLDFDVHADPLRTRTPVTVNTAIDVRSFHANVFSRDCRCATIQSAKQADDRRARRDRDVRRTSVAADVNCAPFAQRVKTFQRQTDRLAFPDLTTAHAFGQLQLARP
jgi:hypothetical protein